MENNMNEFFGQGAESLIAQTEFKSTANYYVKASEMEKTAFKKWMKSMLVMGPVSVTFRKKDGTEREMLCTLQEGVVVPHEKTTDRVKEINDEVCAVWDIDKGAWRSFRYDSIVTIRLDI
jgi:hypothetical protein